MADFALLLTHAEEIEYVRKQRKRSMATQVRTVADKLEERHKDCRIANTVGTNVGIASGLLMLGGDPQ